ncbi:MAG: complex I subunit 5 family protein [Anaerolineaceae bacterium]
MNTATTLIWLFATPFIASPLVYLAGRIHFRFASREVNISRWAALLAALGIDWLIISLTLTSHANPVSVSIGAVVMRFDSVSLALGAVAAGLATLVILFSGPYMAGEDGEEKYYALLLAMTGAMIGLGCASDLFNLWVWFEAMSIASFTLVAFYQNQSASLEAGFKYLVQSAIGSILVVVGIALVFGHTGSLDLAVLSDQIDLSSPTILAAGALFIIGFGVKAALVPLHTWLPDAHSQAPSGISAMLSGVVIEAGLIAMLRALGALSINASMWGSLLLGFGALNMLVGNLMAMCQTQVKRLLAFSSLSHVGYILLGFGTALAFNQVDGGAGAFFHLINHGLMKGLAFLAAGSLLYSLNISRGHHGPLLLEDLNGASRRYPLAALGLSIAVLSLGGLPPLSGFMSKWQIFVAGFQTGNTAVIILVVFAALNSVLSLAYYAPLVNRLYRNEPCEKVEQGAQTGFTMALPLVLLMLAIVVLGFWPSLVNNLSYPAGRALLAAFGY